MSHCQICLHEAPGHYPGCPVQTGDTVVGHIEIPNLILSDALRKLQASLGAINERLASLEDKVAYLVSKETTGGFAVRGTSSAGPHQVHRPKPEHDR